MIEIFRAENGLWVWVLRATGKSGTVLAMSERGYVKRSALLRQLKRVKTLLPTAGIVEMVEMAAKDDAK